MILRNSALSRRGSSAAACLWRPLACLLAFCWLASPAWGITLDGYDLAYGQLTIPYGGGSSPYGTIAEQIRSGLYDGPTGYWDGPGISSSAAANDPSRLTALGVIDDGESVIIKYTWWGDTNLDGVIDSNDYDKVDTAWRLQSPHPTWAMGDFNYDGVIDSNDYDKIDAGWRLAQGGSPPGPPPAHTPEPVTLAGLALGVAGLVRYVRRLAHGPPADGAGPKC